MKKNPNPAQTVGSYPTEIQLILNCARKNIDTETADIIKTLLKQKIDWKYLIQIAETHSVKPLLYQTLNNICRDAVPQTILTKLQKDFRTNAVRNLYLTRELLELLDLFAKNNIPVFCFKGPPLAQSVYGDISLRQFSDLDILVYEKDVIKGKDLLLKQGNKMRFHVIELESTEEAAFLESETIHQFVKESAYEFDYYNAQFVIELHWEVIPKYFAFPLSIDYLKEDLTTVTLLNTSIPNLSPENYLLLLCGHGTKDCWDKLSRICDIAELIRTYPQLNWQFIIEQAQKKGGMRTVLSGVLLAHNLLEAPLPDLVLEKIELDIEIKKIVAQIQNWLFLDSQERSQQIKLFSFHLWTKERLKDKIWYALSIFLTPTTSDWSLLPRSNFPAIFYYLIRPIRMLVKYSLKPKSIDTKVGN